METGRPARHSTIQSAGRYSRPKARSMSSWESSGKEGLILDFLDREIPSDWDSLSRQQRQMFWNGNLKLADGTELVPREKVCAVEIWVECFGGDLKHMKRSDSMEINNILLHGKWQRIKTPRDFGPYGQQRGFVRPTT